MYHVVLTVMTLIYSTGEIVQSVTRWETFERCTEVRDTINNANGGWKYAFIAECSFAPASVTSRLEVNR